MKKIFSLELVILFIIFDLSIPQMAQGEDSFTIGEPINDAKSKMTFPKSDDIQEAKPVEKEKKGFFSKLFKSNKPKKQKRYNSLLNRYEEVPQGYYGTLPNIKQDFKYKEGVSSSAPEIKDMPDIDSVDEKNLKPAPTDDALFLDMIVKKEKQSNYINDIQKTKLALTNLKKCIEEGGNIQRFNGCVNMIDMYSKNLAAKYDNQSDSLRDSYINIQNTNYHAKVLGNLLYEANYYARYTPTQQGKYSKDNIENQKADLLKRINKTLFLIANET